MVGVEEESSGGSEYNIEDDEYKKEYFDSSERLSKKMNQIADWVRKSRHLIVFTGAGISTRYCTLYAYLREESKETILLRCDYSYVYATYLSSSLSLFPPVLEFLIFVVVWTQCSKQARECGSSWPTNQGGGREVRPYPCYKHSLHPHTWLLSNCTRLALSNSLCHRM